MSVTPTLETVSASNLHELATLMAKLWPECEPETEIEHIRSTYPSDNVVYFLAKIDKAHIGFAHFSRRKEYVEGADSSPVLYLEGIYIEPSFRRLGIGSTLVKKGIAWGAARNCQVMASDAELTNEMSHAFHQKTGFREVKRIICYLQELVP